MSVTQKHIAQLNCIFKKSVNAVLNNLLSTENGIHFVTNCHINIRGDQFDLTNKQIFLIGFGKAVLPMAVQLERKFPGIPGILSIPHGTIAQFADNPLMKLRTDTAIQIIEGARDNHPDKEALHAATLIEKSVATCTKNTVVFALVSGGGSALLPMPRPPFKLADKLALIRSLSNSGATIDEMNIVRIALSKVKGGRLGAALSKNAYAVISFIISDIVGDPVALIASGPTVPLKVASHSPYEILNKYNLWQSLSAEKQALVLEPLPTAETLGLKNNYYYIVGHNGMAVDVAISAAQNYNYATCLLTTKLQGDVAHLVEQYIHLFKLILCYRKHEITAKEVAAGFPFKDMNVEALLKTLNEQSNCPLLLILSGEPTVKVKGHGLGGRNQQLALHMSYELYKYPDMHDVIFYSAGTDGIDGPTTAAGAIGCAQVLKDELNGKAERKSTTESVWNSIENNDAYNFYAQLENGKYHIVTGHTGLNVMDLHFIVIPAKSNIKNKL